MATTGQVDVMLDVRTQEEWDTGHIENATLRPGLQTLLQGTEDPEAILRELNLWNCRSCRVVVYCRSGARAGAALIELEAAGFQGPLYNGLGVSQWIEAGYELVNTASVEDRPCFLQDEDATISRQAGVCPTSEPATATPVNQYQMELDAARDLFLTQMELHNATGYSFLYTVDCFCFPQGYPWLVTAELQMMMMGVKPYPLIQPLDNNDNATIDTPSPVQGSMGDTVLSAISTEGVDIVQQESAANLTHTVPATYSILDLFDKIQQAIDTNAHILRVVYDPQWGYPQEIHVDYLENVADDESSVFVTNFTLVDIMEYHQELHPEYIDPDSGMANDTWTEEMQAQFQEQLDLWNSYEFNDYSFHYHWIHGEAEQGFPWMIRVQNNVVVKATNVNGTDIMTTPGSNRTMDDIFATVQASLTDNAADLVTVDYHSIYGYPTNVWIDYDLTQADEELSILVPYFSSEGWI